MSTRWLAVARLPDSALVTAASCGTPGAVEALTHAWLPHVYRWCHRLGGPGFDAEDAAHEIMVILCRRVHTVRDPEAFPAWLYGTTRRVLANHRRRAWWRRWVPGARIPEHTDAEEHGPYASLSAKRAHERVWTTLAELSEAHRDVLVLCDLEERSGPEAAQLLDIPLGTVKSRLRAARVAFREALTTRETLGEPAARRQS